MPPSNLQANLPRFNPDNATPPSLQQVQGLIDDAINSNNRQYFGAGSPEGVITASQGSTYWDTSGQMFYVKDSGSGNTGWAIH